MNDDNVVPMTPELAHAFDRTGFEPLEVPVTIKLKSRVRAFVVPDVNAWGYMNDGIFAIGHWDTDPDVERTVLISNDEVSYLEFDFEAVEAQEPDAGEEDKAA